MAKFLQILAASEGGGLVLGAGIRRGEASCASGENKSRQARREIDDPGELTQRLDRVEREVRSERREAGVDGALAGVVERMDLQQCVLVSLWWLFFVASCVFVSAGLGRC